MLKEIALFALTFQVISEGSISDGYHIGNMFLHRDMTLNCINLKYQMKRCQLPCCVHFDSLSESLRYIDDIQYIDGFIKIISACEEYNDDGIRIREILYEDRQKILLDSLTYIQDLLPFVVDNMEDGYKNLKKIGNLIDEKNATEILIDLLQKMNFRNGGVGKFINLVKNIRENVVSCIFRIRMINLRYKIIDGPNHNSETIDNQIQDIDVIMDRLNHYLRFIKSLPDYSSIMTRRAETRIITLPALPILLNSQR